MEPEKEGD